MAKFFLSPTVDVADVRRVQGDDPKVAGEALARLCLRYEPLFRALIRSLHTREQDIEDGLQGARVGFIEATRRFDPSRGTSLGEYAKGYVTKEILRATFRSPRLKREQIGAKADVSERMSLVTVEDEGYDAVESAFAYPAVRRFVQSLPENRRYIALRVGVEGATRSSVALERSISVRAVCKTWNKIVRAATRSLRPVFDEPPRDLT